MEKSPRLGKSNDTMLVSKQWPHVARTQACLIRRIIRETLILIGREPTRLECALAQVQRHLRPLLSLTRPVPRRLQAHTLLVVAVR